MQPGYHNAQGESHQQYYCQRQQGKPQVLAKGLDFKTNFNIYDLDTSTDEYRVLQKR